MKVPVSENPHSESLEGLDLIALHLKLKDAPQTLVDAIWRDFAVVSCLSLLSALQSLKTHPRACKPQISQFSGWKFKSQKRPPHTFSLRKKQ